MKTFFHSIRLALFTLLLINSVSFAQTQINIGSTPVKVDTLITGLDVPWEIRYHQGSLWTTERRGIVSRIDTASGEKKVLLRLTGTVVQQAESGLLGLALHPDFNGNPDVFLAYTYLNNGLIRERIVKYRYENDTLINPTVLLNDLPGNGTHNGCRLFFMTDTTLLASTGDVQNLSLPQDTSALSGKMLRMRTDGSVPADNPFPGSLVYSLGHRNVQGLTPLPDGRMVMSEHGASTDDEVQLLKAGRNYGWPNVEGYCSSPTEISFCNNNQVVEPMQAYTPTIGPSDVIFYQNPLFPEWHNAVLLTVLKNRQVRALRLNETYDSVLTDIAYLSNSYGRLRDIAIGDNKEIYLATNGASWANTDPNTHSIIRLRPQTGITATRPGIFEKAALHLHPNPSSGDIQFRIDGFSGSRYRLELLNSAGKCVLSENFETRSGKITPKAKTGTGLFLLRVLDENGIGLASERLLIN
jgi:glucose/arabinose dehydrogenase